MIEGKPKSSMKTKDTFASILKSYEDQYDILSLFDDILTMAIFTFSINSETRRSDYEEEYLKVIQKYENCKIQSIFIELLSRLVLEMYESDSLFNNDVLGKFYEQYLFEKGKSTHFIPWPAALFLASVFENEGKLENHKGPIKIFNPNCGSGRLLIASATLKSSVDKFYGIDTNETHVKMAAINLFLNGQFESEVLSINADNPEDFRGSYHISFVPHGIFKIKDKEQSVAWQLYKNPDKHIHTSKADVIFDINGVRRGHCEVQLKLV
jgi:type I restriction-modification system DNA methylase subunit